MVISYTRLTIIRGNKSPLAERILDSAESHRADRIQEIGNQDTARYAYEEQDATAVRPAQVASVGLYPGLGQFRRPRRETRASIQEYEQEGHYPAQYREVPKLQLSSSVYHLENSRCRRSAQEALLTIRSLYISYIHISNIISPIFPFTLTQFPTALCSLPFTSNFFLSGTRPNKPKDCKFQLDKYARSSHLPAAVVVHFGPGPSCPARITRASKSPPPPLSVTCRADTDHIFPVGTST